MKNSTVNSLSLSLSSISNFRRKSVLSEPTLLIHILNKTFLKLQMHACLKQWLKRAEFSKFHKVSMNISVLNTYKKNSSVKIAKKMLQLFVHVLTDFCLWWEIKGLIYVLIEMPKKKLGNEIFQRYLDLLSLINKRTFTTHCWIKLCNPNSTATCFFLAITQHVRF